MSSDKLRTLRIYGARENNLKNVDLELPHDSFVCVTGLSGSGKSSLAFDTVYAEGQRRYIETFSPYTRQFFDKVKKPDVDLIENVRPAVAIQQRTRITSSRSTVGSLTDINDYLKIIWSNLAQAYCPSCGIQITNWNPDSLSQQLRKMVEIGRLEQFLVGAPYRIGAKAKLASEIERLTTLGYSRFFDLHSAQVLRLEDEPALLSSREEVLLILERFERKSFSLRRAKEVLEQCFSLGERRCVLVDLRAPQLRSFVRVENCGTQTNLRNARRFELLNYYAQHTCPDSDLKLERPRPGLFSYNSPIGACAECRGFGKLLKIDPALVVPDQRLSIEQKALACWSGEGTRGEFRRLLRFCETRKIPLARPWSELSAQQKSEIFEHRSREYVGVLPWFKRKERKAYKMHVRVFLSRFRGQFECDACGGTRLKPSALAYRIKGQTLPQVWSMSIAALHHWILTLHKELKSNATLSRHLDDVFKTILARLSYLLALGLPYLSLDRQARTLSGGETQRVNLASALGSELISAHFVLDEPSVGLHMRDTARLIGAMRELQRRGNSLLVVEHDLECIQASDYVLELGPQAGNDGGAVTSFEKSSKFDASAFNLRECLRQTTRADFKRFLTIKSARVRNLKGFDLKIPLGALVCLSGVSGSGKSTLAAEVINGSYERYQLGESNACGVSGFEELAQLLFIDQAPLSKTPRANIATYTGMWDTIRNILAASDAAKNRGLERSAFSFNVDGGRCPNCKGAGYLREDMQFLSDVSIPCEVCLGRRFQPIVLEVTHQELHVHDLLNLSIDRAAQFFAERAEIHALCRTLQALGLGHLTLGHPLSELSGGEAQRLKLVPFMQERGETNSLLIFDEPTTGLHFRDVRRLVELMQLLVSRGHSIICIEHNPIMLLSSDWIIDLGPEGGEAGGQVVLQGAPKLFLDPKKAAQSHTAEFLQKTLSPKRAAAPARLPAFSAPSELCIRNAREHNLKDIKITLPLNQVVVISGVSGSGKSTIAKDIIYAEGQRRYLDCLSPYARQFIKELKKPDIGSISNVMPTVCVYQHTFQPGALSTVGTMSEVYNFLRLLYAKVGDQHCPDHPGQVIAPLSQRQIAENIKRLKAQQVRILAPLIKLKKGHHRAIFERALQLEVMEVRVDGEFGKTSHFAEGLARNKAHSIDFVIARFNPATLDLELIEQSVAQALSFSGSTVQVLADGGEHVFSMERSCPICQRGFFKPDPEDLSFHSRRGACPKCQGRGHLGDKICKTCHGQRLGRTGRHISLAVTGGKRLNIYELSILAPSRIQAGLKNLQLNVRQAALARPVLKELNARLDTLLRFGLDYLNLDRDCSTLSSGELQRLRLASAMGSPLSGVMYIFDEPSAGLHPLDNRRILAKFFELRERGNSVLIIEHDSDTLNQAEHVIDVGPGAGANGGEIVFEGSLTQLKDSSDSLTAKALRGELSLPSFESTPAKQQLRIISGSKHNINKLNLSLPLGRLVTIAGVSGAGKSSLLHGIICDTLNLGQSTKQGWSLEGVAELRSETEIAQVLMIDQAPIGKNSRSTPASYLGIWDEIRKLFASSIEARSRGFNWSYFSYNSGKGRCPECKGVGEIKLEMSFMAEANVICESCGGKRYTEEADSFLYGGISISQALGLTFDQARLKFANHRRAHQLLHQACELGLGYLTLGQSSNTLSGGESQRIKLVAELASKRKGHVLYVLDEPTTGLHRADVFKLIEVLRRLTEQGHSVFLIEHDRDVLEHSDWIVELGPGPAEQGGKVIFNGALSELRKSPTPWGRLLQNFSPSGSNVRERSVAQTV